MKPQTLLKLALATLACFLISFAISKASGQGEKGYPESLIERYAQGIKCSPEKNETPLKEEVRKVEVKGLHEVELNVISADVQVKLSDSDQIELKGTSKGSLSIADSIDGDVLRFTENKGATGGGGIKFNCLPDIAHGFGITIDDGDQSKYILSIPKGFERVHIHAVSGDIHVDSLALKLLKIETTSGDVHAEAGKVKEIRLKTVSGDQKLDLDEGHPQMMVESVSGDVNLSVKKALSAKLQVKTVSGDVEIDGKEIEGEEPVGHHFSKTFGKGEGSIDVRTVSGDFRIELE